MPNLSLPKERESKPSTLRRQITESRRAVRRLRKDARTAAKDIAKNGASVIATRCDNAGNPHEKNVPNPALRTLRDAEATIKTLTQKLAKLTREYEQAVQKAEAESGGANEFDF